MKNRKRFDQINVIPFIDIMLVLLVMVLTTATFIKQGVISVNLPHASASKKQDVHKDITIYINKTGTLYMDKKKVTQKVLEQQLATLSKKQTIILRSDRESKFQDFVTVMNILKKLQLTELYIATKKTD